MTAGAFLSDRLGRLVLWLTSMAVGALFLLATGTGRGIVCILGIAGALVFLTVQIVDYCRQRSHLEELEAVMAGLDEKYLFAECAPKPQGMYERRLFDLMRRSEKAMLGAVSDAQAAQREYREYVENWVHEIKTPITAAQLIARGAGADTRRKLTRELGEIEDHVERALFYARAESPEKDFLIRRASLAEIVTQAIGRHRALLLQSGVRVETEGLDREVYTDEKWAGFLLGQLLQNAVRYRGEAPVITLSARDLGRQVQLAVRDNGIGIPAHELPRVCERGFTGSNGRARGGSTGMGLYLCRRLAGFLQIDLRFQSEAGAGTTVLLTFPAKENLSKL